MAARQACDRTEIDDRAATAPDHFGNGVFRHQHDRGDIDAHRTVPCLYVYLDGIAARPGDADIVDEDVEPAPGLRCARDNRLTRCGNADVTHDDLRHTAFCVDQALGLFRPWRSGGDQHHLRAVPRQNDRRSAAVADTLGTRTRAGDNGHLALETVVSANCSHDVRGVCPNELI